MRGKTIDMCRSIHFTISRYMATPHDDLTFIHTAPPGPTVPPSGPAGSPAVASRVLLLPTQACRGSLQPYRQGLSHHAH
eukprot:scaffold3777_cov123-Isochrysis_galbana.AAC.15